MVFQKPDFDNIIMDDKMGIQGESEIVRDIMTSELVYRFRSLDDAFFSEYSRRLHLIGLDDNEINNLLSIESLVLSIGCMSEHRKQLWTRRNFINFDLTPEKLPKADEMTLSELILITKDANSSFWREYDTLSEKAWQALYISACCSKNTEARYVSAFNLRTKDFSWSEAQRRVYIRNENLLIDRLKFGIHENLSWTPETTDLKKYQKEDFFLR